MDEQALNMFIKQEIQKVVYDDRIELFLPFYFGQNVSQPLCLVWDKDGTLSDRGRTLSELKKRVGDLSPYMISIENILSSLGTVALVGGQNLVVSSFQTCIDGERTYKDYLGGLNRLIRAISQISIVDKITVDKDGAVSLC